MLVGPLSNEYGSYIRQLKPDSSLGSQVKVHETFQALPFSLGNCTGQSDSWLASGVMASMMDAVLEAVNLEGLRLAVGGSGFEVGGSGSRNQYSIAQVFHPTRKPA